MLGDDAGRVYSRAMSAKKTARRIKATTKSKAPKPSKLVRGKSKAPPKSAPAPKARKSIARKAKKTPRASAVVKKSTAKKLAKRGKAKPAAVAKTPKKKPAIVRRDGSGHLDPKYAATLRAQSPKRAKDNDRAFFRESRSGDDLAEELGEEAVEKMTSGEDDAEESLNERVTEEDGGPFVPTSGKTEFGYDTDASNPKGATREPFPKS